MVYDAAHGKYTVHVGDAEEVARELSGFHAVLCDPPYGIAFMSKGWDHSVPSPDLWRSVYGALLPGAHVLAFGGTRMFHRTTCAVEDAGFEIRDCLMWLYGTGFPKSYNISRAAGAERDAQRFDGYGTALKPAWEPCILARKPLAGTVADNAVEHGAGALNIDGARVGDEIDAGRWPSNVILDDTAAAALDGHTVDEVSRFFYCAKASRDEREAGLDGFEAVDGGEVTGRGPGSSGAQNSCYSGTTESPRRNIHPTVKPVDLCRYLATLLLPPPSDEPRRILVPFSGSGSEMIGCLLAGWDEVVGIEMNPEYADIALARLAHWKRYGRADSQAAEAESVGQGSLF